MSAQKLVGVKFSDSQIDTMITNLARIRSTYDTTQKLEMGIDEASIIRLVHAYQLETSHKTLIPPLFEH